MYRLPKNDNSSGQALLIVLLSMAVVLTIVLSILARSVTDISMTTRDEASLRAFSAAEAGIEKALIAGSSIGATVIGDASYTANVTSVAEGTNEFVSPLALSSGETNTVWFVAHDGEGNLICSAEKPCFTGSKINICWGNSGASSDAATTPAVEVSVFYLNSVGDYSTTRVARAAIDPNTTRRASNNFLAPDAGSCTIGGSTFPFQKALNFASDLGIPGGSFNSENGLQFARVKFFYNTDSTSPLGVSVNYAGATLLPSQGINIESTGTSGQGEANRKLEVFQSFGETPSIFDSVIYSPGGITK